ncbi:MAG: alkaline phosphatase [Armatimonadetes bacterium]|nr:alkaline phosphatase [Armatimonadota bacterium]
MKLRIVCALLLLSLLLGVNAVLSRPASPHREQARARNVILMIGDGMGAEHIRATGLRQNGRAGSLALESLPHRAEVITDSTEGTTDSAAAATAMATGQKVENGVLSVALPGDGRPLTTVLELAAARNRRVGLVTTSFLEDATPAAFAAHSPTRDAHPAIAREYFDTTRPQLLFGGRTDFCTPEQAQKAGYAVLDEAADLEKLPQGEYLAGLFGPGGPLPYEYDGNYAGIPRLTDMTRAALDALEEAPHGFFLLVENENIDSAAHENHLERTVSAVSELDRTVKLVLEWAGSRRDTLILVTGDHETGGLQYFEDGGPRWSTKGHTRWPVLAFATGPGAEQIRGTLDNTDLCRIMMEAVR